MNPKSAWSSVDTGKLHLMNTQQVVVIKSEPEADNISAWPTLGIMAAVLIGVLKIIFG